MERITKYLIFEPSKNSVFIRISSEAYRQTPKKFRARNCDIYSFDIYDRVNYAVTNSKLQFAKDSTEILLSLSIDTEIFPILSYFEIFMKRMVLCMKATAQLERSFGLMINGQRVL